MVSRDTSHPKQVQSEEEMRDLKSFMETELLTEVLTTFAGRHVIYGILARCGIYEDIYSPDVALTNRLLGRRSIGLELVEEALTAKPDVYILMQKEGAAFEKKYQFEIVDTEEEREDE